MVPCCIWRLICGPGSTLLHEMTHLDAVAKKFLPKQVLFIVNRQSHYLNPSTVPLATPFHSSSQLICLSPPAIRMHMMNIQPKTGPKAPNQSSPHAAWRLLWITIPKEPMFRRPNSTPKVMPVPPLSFGPRNSARKISSRQRTGIRLEYGKTVSWEDDAGSGRSWINKWRMRYR